MKDNVEKVLERDAKLTGVLDAYGCAWYSVDEPRSVCVL